MKNILDHYNEVNIALNEFLDDESVIDMLEFVPDIDNWQSDLDKGGGRTDYTEEDNSITIDELAVIYLVEGNDLTIHDDKWDLEECIKWVKLFDDFALVIYC